MDLPQSARRLLLLRPLSFFHPFAEFIALIGMAFDAAVFARSAFCDEANQALALLPIQQAIYRKTYGKTSRYLYYGE